MKRLDGKSILVAGGGGIGAELARRYAQEGAGVLLGDLDLDGARAVAGDIERAGGRARAIRLDGADEDSVAAAVALACETYGGLDGLHANFATFVDGGFDTGVLELPLADYDETMRVNARGYLLCTRHALPAIIARGGGSIVYTSSLAADAGEPCRVAYAMSKAAVHALMRHVAARYGRDGVRANCIAPGVTLHERVKSAVGPEFMEWALGIAHIKSRTGRPDDIASVGALLLSDEGSFITGQIISVDGGATMRP
ncbi:SDR family oxidoreductase [Phenylobacterium sp. LjRoot225]|uniref:SDR family NAD(P)-dependent oxidoreductase n=1 Tax=Phenylobacterium sp. LjRoot225 TaxID=3342285 RepID=UPI003ECF474E